MGKYVVRRLLQAIPTILGIMILTFLLTRLSPSDPVEILLANQPDVTEREREELREALGLNEPLPIQFLVWTRDAVLLDFGDSFIQRRPVSAILAERVPNTLQLSVTGLVVSLLIGIPAGVAAALLRGRPTDHVIRVMSVLLHATPAFYLGLLFILFFGVQLRLFPVGSMNTVGESCALCLDRAWHMVGPVLLYAASGIAIFPRFLRTEMLEILGQEYVRTARGKGLAERVVLIRHALRNALIPVVTLLGGLLTIFISGSVVIEQVFNWPGLGRLLFDAANQKDFPVVQAAVLISSLLLVVSFILRDIAYAWVDPRIRVGR